MEKRCPTCDRRYVEEELNYCLVDGSLLLKANELSPPGASTVKITAAAPTEVLPPGQLGIPTEALADGETTTSQGKLSYPEPRPFLSTRNIIALAVAVLLLAGLGLFISIWLKTFLTSPSSANVNSPANNNAAAAKPAASPNPTSGTLALEGTIWSGTNSRGEKSEFYFLSSGRLRYKWKDKFYDKPGDKWSQTGDAVTMRLSNGALKYSGIIKGDQIDFDVSNEAGDKWKLSLRRVK
ncbi:MAG TPA: hypothetical protein VGC66_01210 [Pyrinomonadaceae bacterium]|jgi:hypothetical protein